MTAHSTLPTLAALALGAALGLSAPALAQQATGAAGTVSASSIREHMEVLGSDGGHVGTVDKVEGQTIALTRDDPASGGQHHTIPMAWVASVGQRGVMLNKPAQQAKQEWQTAASPPADNTRK